VNGDQGRNGWGSRNNTPGVKECLDAKRNVDANCEKRTESRTDENNKENSSIKQLRKERGNSLNEFGGVKRAKSKKGDGTDKNIVDIKRRRHKFPMTQLSRRGEDAEDQKEKKH